MTDRQAGVGSSEGEEVFVPQSARVVGFVEFSHHQALLYEEGLGENLNSVDYLVSLGRLDVGKYQDNSLELGWARSETTSKGS